MTTRLSTGLRNSLVGGLATVKAMVGGDDIALVDGGASDDTITRTAADFVSAGFEIGDRIYIKGATNGANNISGIPLTSVAAGTLGVPTGTWAAAQGSGVDMAISVAIGGAWRDALRNGILRIYSGAQPASADDAEAGTLLVTITDGGLAFVAGQAANGINLGDPSAGVCGIASGESWSGTALASGTAGWFRYYNNAYVTGASVTAVRFDGAAGLAGTQLTLSTLTITSGVPVTVNSFQVTQPAA